MGRATIILFDPTARAKATEWIAKAPPETAVTFKRNKRSVPQNARMWAMLTEISQQAGWHGQKLSADDWKLVFLDALHRELRIVPNLDGTGFVQLGRSSSDLTRSEMGDLMELMTAWAAKNGIELREGPA